jgi:hypothetical protein
LSPAAGVRIVSSALPLLEQLPTLNTLRNRLELTPEQATTPQQHEWREFISEFREKAKERIEEKRE